MDKIDYSEQNQLPLTIPETITVLGVGGAGAYVALFAALAGVKKIIMIDGADVKSTDVSRLPINPEQLGNKKVSAIAAVIRQFRPKIEILEIDNWFEIPESCSLLEGLVINTAASNRMEQELPAICKAGGLSYISGGYFGLGAAVFNECPEGISIIEPATATWVGSGALAAALILTSAFGERFEGVVSPGLFSNRELTVKDSIANFLGSFGIAK